MNARDYVASNRYGYKIGFVVKPQYCGADEGGRLKIGIARSGTITLSYVDAKGGTASRSALSWNNTSKVIYNTDHNSIEGLVNIYNGKGAYVVHPFIITLDRRWPQELSKKRIHVYVGRRKGGGGQPDDGSYTGDDR